MTKIVFPYTEELLILDKIFNNNGKNDNLRIVGGAVRNFLMGRPVSDYDLSCKFTPNENIEILKDNNIKCIPTGIKFGTITAIIDNKTFEITSTRKDIKTDGRHAEVEYTNSFEVDSGRRDFTFNALYLDFKGNVYDYHDGLVDLKKGVVRFIGDVERRIQEDYLRILRFFRFYCYYGSALDTEGLKYSIKHKDKLKNLSGERIKAEMFKILKANYPIETLNIMSQNNILQIITELNDFSFDNLELLYSVKPYIKAKINVYLVLTLILNDTEDLKILRDKWKLSNIETNEISKLLKHKNEERYNEKIIKMFLFLGYDIEHITNLIIVNSIVNSGSHSIADSINNLINHIKDIEIPTFPIKTEDLFNYGFSDKTMYGDLLNRGKKIFVDSDFELTKDEILNILSRQ